MFYGLGVMYYYVYGFGLGFLLERKLGILRWRIWVQALYVLVCCGGVGLEMCIFLGGWVDFVVGGRDFGFWWVRSFFPLWCWGRISIEGYGPMRWWFVPFGLWDFGISELRDMIFLSPWYKAQGGRAVGKTVLPPVRKRYLRGGMPRYIGSVLIRYLWFGVTVWKSNIGGRGGFSYLGGPLSVEVHPLLSLLANQEGPKA